VGNLWGRVGAVAFILAVLASVFWWRTMLWTGQLDGIKPHFDGTCSIAAPIVGAEDLVIDRDQRTVFVSSHDRRNFEAPGSIWALPVDAPQNAKALPLSGLKDAHLAPHGLDLVIAEDGTRYLFVIDHGSRPRDLVRKFRVEDAGLVFVETFSDPLFYAPNDIVAVSENEFYLTNDNKEASNALFAFLAVLMRQQSGNVVHVKDGIASIAADGFAYANGIAVSKNGARLYATGTVDQALHVFDRNPLTGALVLIDLVPLQSGLDNIDIAEDGSLWIGSHPRLFDFSAHAKDPAKRSPSQVFTLDPQKQSITEVYLSDGNPLSAVSVAARIDQQIFMGGVFDTGVLQCTLQ
jgi:arylesterase/paraoxonase